MSNPYNYRKPCSNKLETLPCNTSCVMAPKVKASSSKGEAFAPKRPLNKDLMEQLPPSPLINPRANYFSEVHK